MKLLRFIIQIIFCKILFRVKYENEEVLKKFDKAIICPNHSNVFEPIFFFPLEKENLYIMAKSELFKNKFINWLFTKNNIFPINRNKTDPKSMFHSLEIFEENEKAKLLIFTEGKVIRWKKDIGKYFKKGAVFIAGNCNVPIIPVYITRRPIFFMRITVTFGEPIFIEKSQIQDKQNVVKLSKNLIREIYKLNPEIDKQIIENNLEG